jgi:bifunctional non-homologous end joining protein LigD
MIVGGVEVSSPDRLVYPDQKITKRQLAEYYVAVAPLMLPHAAKRPISMVRCPQGLAAQCFYQKHWQHTLPSGLGTVDVVEEGGDTEPYVFVKDAAGLVALVQYGVMEVHLWGARADDVESPDRVVFDLDPAPDVPWRRVVDLAKEMRELLADCNLDSWVKTTGGKGLHVVVPIQRTVTWHDVHDFVRLVTAHMISRHPNELLDVASKAKRQGKIFIDYLRNSRGATAIAPWSTRSRDGAPVSIPYEWEQIDELDAGDSMRLADAAKLARSLRSDPWAEMLKSRQRITQKVMEFLLR